MIHRLKERRALRAGRCRTRPLGARASIARAATLALIATVASPVAGRAAAQQFEAYAVSVYSGRLAPPDFKHEPGYRRMRTVIREGARGGVNFAGHYAVIQTGCGTDCWNVTLVDLRSGYIFDFPLGGEQYYDLGLDYRPGSRLLKAHWQDMGGANPVCVRQDFIVKASSFASFTLSRGAGQCPR